MGTSAHMGCESHRKRVYSPPHTLAPLESFYSGTVTHFVPPKFHPTLSLQIQLFSAVVALFCWFGVLLLFFVGLFVSYHLHTFLVREIQTHSHDSTRLISQDLGIKHKSRCGASPWTYQTSGCYCFCLCMLLTVTCEY